MTADARASLPRASGTAQPIVSKVRKSSFESADRLGAELATFAPFTDTRIGAIETDKKTNAKRFSVTISMGGETTRR